MKLYVKECRKADLRKKQTPTWLDKLTFWTLSCLVKLSMKFTDMLFQLMENNSRGY